MPHAVQTRVLWVGKHAQVLTPQRLCAQRYCSAGFQPAVSPTSSRLTVHTSHDLRIGNPRYPGAPGEVCTTVPHPAAQSL
jgi:hypothetical protein